MITEFVRASSIDDAVSLAERGYLFLAGGTQVNRAPRRGDETKAVKVVSLESLDLGGISAADAAAGNGASGGCRSVVVGAAATLQEIVDSDAVPEPLRRAAGFIPTRSVRNIATIGGNVGAGRPDSYIIPALIALGATADTVRPGGPETVSVETYVAEGRSDLILRFTVPLPGDGVAVEAVKESRSHLALPVVSAAVRIEAEGEAVTTAVIAAGCTGPHVVRLTAVEDALKSGCLREEGELEDAIARSIESTPDILGSTAYKTYVNSVVIADAVRLAVRRAMGGGAKGRSAEESRGVETPTVGSDSTTGARGVRS